MKAVVLPVVCLFVSIIFFWQLHIYFSKKEKPNIDMLIFGNDTIVVIGAKGIDYSKGHFELNGYGDSGVWYHEIKLYHKIKDTVIYYEDAMKIGTHKGDILTGEAVKNVYNK